jgi:AcrR family transcriptional regulator
MPRQPDPELEGRILQAARKLLDKGAERAFTMRAVAEAAGTNTPAVYRRFRDRRAILRALLLRIRQEFIELLEASSSPEGACEAYLDFALSHANEYELFHKFGHEFFHRSWSGKERSEARPGVEAMKRKLAEKLGGPADSYTRLALALWALAHGTVMLFNAKTILPDLGAEMRESFSASVRVLIGDAPALTPKVRARR